MPPPSTVAPSMRPLIAEHRALRAALADLKAALSPRDPNTQGGPDVVAARLDVLRGRIAVHFATEERSGLFEQIVERAPEQAHTCQRLREEHEAVLRQLDDLRAFGPEARRAPEWARGVRSLLSELAAHEARENELIARVLDGSAGAGD